METGDNEKTSTKIFPSDIFLVIPRGLAKVEIFVFESVDSPELDALILKLNDEGRIWYLANKIERMRKL